MARRKRPSKPESGTELSGPANKREAGPEAPGAASRRGTTPAVTKEALSACVEAAPLAMLIIDSGGGIVFVNARAEQLFGYGREELIGRPIETLVPDAFWDARTKQRIDYFADPPVRSMTGRVLAALRKDRSEFVAELGLALARSDSEVLAIATVVDVTEPKRTEEALRESEALWHGLVENAPGIVGMGDRDGTIWFINKAVRGVPPEKVIGSKIYDFMPAQHHEATRIVLEETFKSGNVSSYDFGWTKRDGRAVWYTARVGPIRLDGQVIGLSMIATNITERKQAEEALREREERFVGLERRGSYGLTFREMTVLYLVAEGKADKEIAAVLGIRPLTVSKHVSNVLGKMNSKSRTEAGTRALREGLLD